MSSDIVVRPSRRNKLTRLREASLRIAFEQSAHQYETNPKFRATVQRLSESVIARNAKEEAAGKVDA